MFQAMQQSYHFYYVHASLKFSRMNQETKS